MAELRIRVSAYSDRSMDVAYRSLIESGERARRSIGESMRGAATAVAGETKKGTSKAELEYSKLAAAAQRWQRQMVRDAEKSANDATKAKEKAARDEIRAATQAARERARAEIAAEREIAREIASGNRARERALAASERARSRAASARQQAFDDAKSGIAGGALSLGARAGREALSIMGDVARGAGVDTDLSSHVRKGVDLERAAVDLSNAGFFTGKDGAAGIRQDPKAIENQVRSVAMNTGQESGNVMTGLQKFVAKTGDLQAGRDSLESMGRMAKATGANIEDVLDAAGDVSNALGDVPEKGKAIEQVMGAVAAQGKEAAVEIKDLATQMAKLGGASTSFSGDRAVVMAQLGAVTQMTRAKGGAASATQAATSATSFANTFSKGARLDAFQKFNVDFRGEDGRVDIRKVILNSIKAASSKQFGGMEKFDRNMGQMFMDVRARSAVKGYEAIYKEAGGGEAGIAAVAKAFDDLSNSVLNQKEVSDSFSAAMSTTDTQAKQFNEQMGLLAAELRTNLTPAFRELAPLVIAGAKKLTDFVGDVTGANEEKRTAALTDLDMRSLKTVKALQTGQEGAAPAVDQQHLKDAAQLQKDLEVAIADQRKRLGAKREELGFGKALGADDKKLEELARSDPEHQPAAVKYVRDKEMLAELQKQLENVKREQNAVNEKHMAGMLRVLEGASTGGGALRVEVVSGTPPTTDPAKTTDMSGTP